MTQMLNWRALTWSRTRFAQALYSRRVFAAATRGDATRTRLKRDVVGETELSVGSASAPAETPRGSLAAKDGCDPRTRGRRIPNENGNSWLDKRLPLVTPIARDGEPVNPEAEQ